LNLIAVIQEKLHSHEQFLHHFFDNEDIQNYMKSYMLSDEQMMEYYGYSINQLYKFTKQPSIDKFLALQKLATTTWHGSELDVTPTFVYYYLIKSGSLAYSYENIDKNNQKLVFNEKDHVFYLENHECNRDSLLAHFLKVDVVNHIFSIETLQSLSRMPEMYNLLHHKHFIEDFFLTLNQYPHLMEQYFENIFDIVSPHGFNLLKVLNPENESVFPSVMKVVKAYSHYRGKLDSILTEKDLSFK
jgi:hypothetical protein